MRYVIRFTRFMWIPTLWQAEPALTIRNSETWSDVIYMPCTAENNFCTGTAERDSGYYLSVLPEQPDRRRRSQKTQLQEWVDYANKAGAVIIYDAAYEAYITEEDVPHVYL